ncbi:MAG: DUF2007 domain-containing protein [Dysgonamonadaceae bacterium]|jgi:hypothetical protein|nr:DUF2007 domain-containing protein [Dysgonamonadaceae bacterium]
MKLIEIARFTYPNEVSVLESILQSEDVRHFFRNMNSAVAYAPIVPIILEVAEDDLSRALEVMKEAGFGEYISYSEDK